MFYNECFPERISTSVNKLVLVKNPISNSVNVLFYFKLSKIRLLIIEINNLYALSYQIYTLGN